ncbi:MAG: PAS domain S-box protein [Desulfobulbaceae bacterium]|nr:PAS domain S-box protein [Desulfobulbaceae bacterium]
MTDKPTYEALQERVRELEAENHRLAGMEAELKRNLKFTDSLLAAIPTAVFYKDVQGRYLGCNPAFSELMGFTPEQLSGKTVQELWPGEHAAVYHQKDLELIRNQTRQIYEFEVLDRHGINRPVIFYKDVFRDEQGRVAGLVGGFVDISELRQAEAEFQAIFSMSLDMLCIADIQTATFLKVNPAFMATLGYSETELLGQPFSAFIHPKDVASTQAVVTERLQQGEKVINFRNRYRCKNGTYRWLNWASHPLPENGVTYAVAHDITAEIEAHENLQRQHDLLDSLFDNIALGITVWSADGRLLMANRGFWTLTGYTPGELSGLDDWLARAYPDPDYRRQVMADWPVAHSAANAVREFKVVCKGGVVKEIEFRSTFLKDKRALVTLADVTERRRIGEEREAAHQLLQSVLDAVPDLLIVVDRDFTILYTNSKGHDHISSPPEAGRQNTCYGRFKHLDAPCEDCSAQPVFASGTSISREIVNPADGCLREVRVFPIRDASGDVTRVVEYVRDITEIRQAQEEIRERRTFLESVLYHAPDAIVTMDAQHRVIDWNPGAEKMFGYSPAEAFGRQLDDLVADQSHQDEAGAKTSQVLSGRRVEAFETVRRHKDGTPRHVIAAGSPIVVDGVLKGVMAVYTDITGRVQAEQALRATHQRFLAVMDSIDATIYVADMESYEILYMNRNMIASLGRDVTGEICWQAFRSGTGPCADCTNAKLLDAEGQPMGVVTWKGINPINKRWYMNYDRAIEWVDGRLVRLQIAVDITENQKMEEAFQRAQKMEAIGTLAGGIAHDFNNLLTGIQGNASLMWMNPDIPDLCKDHVVAIESYVNSAKDLTAQLLGVARGGKYEISPVDINHLASGVMAMFGRTHKEIRLHHQLQASPLIVDVDRRQIEQVLLNIFINAMHAMPAGGDLYLKATSVSLDKSLSQVHGIAVGRYVKLSITDTGIGMDDDTRQRIFDPFFTTKEKGRGTGLGLASAFGIIKNHGGTITVYSELGRGATFNVYLPVSDRTPEPQVVATDQIITGIETILLVDDEEMIRTVADAMLTKLGYRVLVATGGSEALAIVAEQGDAVDLVILDMIMPGMDGGQTYDRLRELHPLLPVLLSSGYAINGHAIEIMQRGCDGFIQKPFSIAELSQKIRRVLDGSNNSG